MSIKLHAATKTKTDIDTVARVGIAGFDPIRDAVVRNLFPTLEEDTLLQWLRKQNRAAVDNPNAVLIIPEDGPDVVGWAVWMAPHGKNETSKSIPVILPNMDKEAAAKLRDDISRSEEAVFGDESSINAWGKAHITYKHSTPVLGNLHTNTLHSISAGFPGRRSEISRTGHWQIASPMGNRAGQGGLQGLLCCCGFSDWTTLLCLRWI